MKPSRLLFAELTREELKAIAPDALAVLPIGATEQHGPHLPTGTDYFAVEHLAREAARIAAETIPVVVTPALPFGSSDHHFVFGATLSFSTETYYRVLRELVTSLARDGFTKIFIVNGHGGNHELAQLAARDVALNPPGPPIRVAAGSYWNIAWDALVAEGANLGQRLPGHAGIFETSIMLHLHGDLVAPARPHRDNVGDTDPRSFHQPIRKEESGWWRGIDGYTDSPDQATPERGARYAAAVARVLAKEFTDFWSAK